MSRSGSDSSTSSSWSASSSESVVRRKPVSSLFQHRKTHRCASCNNEQTPKWQPMRFVSSKIQDIPGRFSRPPPLEVANTALHSKDDRFNASYTEHMDQNALKPMFKDGKEAFIMGYQAARAANDPKFARAISTGSVELMMKANGDVKVRRDSGYEELPRQATEETKQDSKKKVKFAGGDCLTGWINENVVREPEGVGMGHDRPLRDTYYRNPTSSYPQDQPRPILRGAPRRKPLNCEKVPSYPLQKVDVRPRSAFTELRRELRSSDRLIEKHPEPMVSEEQPNLPQGSSVHVPSKPGFQFLYVAPFRKTMKFQPITQVKDQHSSNETVIRTEKSSVERQRVSHRAHRREKKAGRIIKATAPLMRTFSPQKQENEAEQVEEENVSSQAARIPQIGDMYMVFCLGVLAAFATAMAGSVVKWYILESN